MNTRSFSRFTMLGAAALAVSLGAQAWAQSSSGSGAKPKPRTAPQSQRKSPVDLENQAKERRPGQVMPGDLAPGQTAPALGPTSALPPPATPEAPPANPVTEPARTPAPAAQPEAPPAPADPTGVMARPLPQHLLVESGVTQNPPPAAGYTPARVRIADPGAGHAEWRSTTGAWQPMEGGLKGEGRIEVRAGTDADLLLVVDDAVEVRVGRLARLTIERATESDGAITVSLVLSRGLIDVRRTTAPAEDEAPTQTASRWFARVRTPDRSVALAAPAQLSYDAFAGTRLRLTERP